MCFGSTSFCIFIYTFSVFLFGLYLRYLNFQDYFHCYACKELDLREESYDYVVVGSGSAGSIVARRLAENKNLKILLMEAGSSGSNLLQIPASAVMLQNSDFDWQYRTVPQKKACLGLDKKISSWPMGKILGGSFMLNNMIYVRGHPDDFVRWYPNMCDFNHSIDILPYFEKLEKSISISDPRFRSNISDYILQAGICMGFGISNGLDAEPGFSNVKLTMKNGQRWTSYDQLSANKPRNLHIITNAFVERVLFRNSTEAYGVSFKHLDADFQVKAAKGVILSAGAVGTPKILMLSGVGPSKHLKQMKITPRVDLPVGDNLQDHVTTGLDLVTLDYPSDLGIRQIVSPSSIFSYFFKSNGPWTTVGCENIAFFNTDKQDVPELQFMVFPMGVTADQGSHLRSLIGIGDKLWDRYFSKIDKPTLTILPIVLHPKSRGTVRLKSKNPQTPPLIEPNYLSDKYDVEVLIQGIEMIKEMIETPSMKKLGAKLNNLKFPGCEHLDFNTKSYWECYVRHFTLTVYHPVGTCKLGEVLDYDFRVRGTTKLYVVDGSVLPDLPSGNPNGPIMMMAERASELIKHHCWHSQRKCCAAELFDLECQC